jgi:hypothetical protein
LTGCLNAVRATGISTHPIESTAGIAIEAVEIMGKAQTLVVERLTGAPSVSVITNALRLNRITL